MSVCTLVHVVAAALGATTAQAASTKSGDGIRVAGTCSDTSTSKLKLKRDNGRLQVEFEVDQNRNAVPWTVELRKDGRVVFQGTRLTHAPAAPSASSAASPARRASSRPAPRATVTCTATAQAAKIAAASSSTAAPAAPATPASGAVVSDDGPAHDVNDDHGGHGTTHA